MMNEPDFFWKNFRLGTELQISGTYLYNALYSLDQIEYLRFEEDIFEILYNLAQGIERIEKITIILLEHTSTTDQERFEKDLITHNHLELLKRIRESKTLSLGKIHTKFLSLLSDFYNSYRYSRYNKSSVYHKNFDKYKFLEFLASSLNLEIDDQFDCIKNSPQIKKFVGKLVGKIVSEFYGLIRNRAYEIGTFTYEIRYNSKAFKIFTAKEYTFEKENNLKKEILISLLCGGFTDEFIDYIKTLSPLPFDSHNSTYYIKYLFNNLTSSVINEYEHFIEEKIATKEDRYQDISPIGESHYLSGDFTGWFEDSP